MWGDVLSLRFPQAVVEAFEFDITLFNAAASVEKASLGQTHDGID